MECLLKISEFTKLFGISRKLLIFYDKQRVLKLKHMDSRNGGAVMQKVAIVEDEIKAAESLLACLKQYGEATGRIFDVTLYQDGISFLTNRNVQFDIVFFDIAMPGLNGMETAIRLRENDSCIQIVFVTSMAQFAIQGYEVNAVDFIVKPIKYERLARTMDRVISKIEKMGGKEVVIKSASRIVRLNSNQIYYIEVMRHYLKFHTDQGVIENYGNLKPLEDELQSYGFAKCNNCYLLNLKYISGVQGDCVLIGGDELSISRKRKKEFLELVAGYLSAR